MTRVHIAIFLSTILGLLGACNQGPTAGQISLMLLNQRDHSVYLPANSLPLQIKDSADQVWSPDTGWGGITCGQCQQQCESNLHGDPAPVWIEIPAGERLTLPWDGRLYRRSSGGCGCGGWSCYEPTTAEDGHYAFLLYYDTTLPGHGAPYNSTQLNTALPAWVGSGMGVASARQMYSFKVHYQGEDAVLFKLQ